MEKRISYSNFMSVKRVAQAINPLVVKRAKLGEKLKEIAEEYKGLSDQIDAYEAGVKAVTGCSVEMLVKKVTEPGIDKNGNATKTVKYVPTDIVTYDENKKQYIITIPEAEEEPTESTESSSDNTNPVNE